MHREPTVSVLMTVYNNDRYLLRAIDSILTQTFTDLEFIIVDDGSTDGSAAILNKCAARDARIRLIRQANQGISAAANAGLALACGEYLARMDSDDIALPDRIERQVAYLRAHPKCVAVGGRVRLIDPDGLPIREMGEHTDHASIDAEHMAGRGGAIIQPAVMMRRAVVQSLGGYNVEYSMSEDFDMFLRLAEVGEVANLPEVVLEYRQHPRSAGYARRAQQAQRAHRALMDAYRRRGLTPATDATHEADNTSSSSAGIDTDALAERNATLADHHRKWAWWALAAGHIRTARKHAMAALLRSPWVGESWRAAACAMRGR